MKKKHKVPIHVYQGTKGLEIVICSSTGHYTVIHGLSKWDFIKLCLKTIFMGRRTRVSL